MDWQRARKPEQKAIRRREILDAAHTLFAELEYEAISLNAIAREAGISKPNVYRYFSTREEIFLQIFLEVFQAWAESMHDALMQLQIPASARQIAESWTAVIRKHPRLLRLAGLLMTSMERNSSEEGLYTFKKAMHQLLDRVAEDLKRVLPSMSEKGRRQMLVCSYGLIAGLGPMAYPNEVLTRVMERPEFAGRQPDFDELMTHALTALIEQDTR
ncbi:MAG: TetR family transcriptional regulator [Phycisphaerales bacterium]|nr:MAG: TetR family transcriptional regulator [Phycisphaerales bacterium]